MCSAFEDEYQNATAGRNAELELLAKLKEFINQEAEIFGDYGPNDVEASNNFKNEYKSSLQGQVNMFIQMREQKTSEHRKKMTAALKTHKKSKKHH